MTLYDLLRIRAGGSQALAGWCYLNGDGETTYSLTASELYERAEGLALEMRQRWKVGTRAILLFDAEPEFLVTFFACLSARLIPIPCPVDGNARTRRAQSIAGDSRAEVFFASGQSYKRLRQDLTADGFDLVDVGCLSTHLVTSLDGTDQSHNQNLEQIAYLQYTSGSTETPRGVMVGHGNAIANLRSIDDGFQHSPDSVIVTWLPHYHDMGLVYGLLQALYSSCKCYVLSPRLFLADPLLWLEIMSRYAGTHSGAPTFGYKLCNQRANGSNQRRFDLSRWRIAFCGAEQVVQSTLDRFRDNFTASGFRGDSFVAAYGLAEATLKVTSSPASRPLRVLDYRPEGSGVDGGHAKSRSRRIVGCGYPSRGTTIAIVSPETREFCGEGQSGEIWVAGDSVALGYWGALQRSMDTFGAVASEGVCRTFLRTGDLGFIQDGELFVTGRLKNILIVRGRIFQAEDLEQTILDAHPRLAGGGAILTSETGEDDGFAIIHEVDSGPDHELTSVRSAIRRMVALRYGIQPHTITLVRRGTLPRTSSGKIIRQACRKHLQAVRSRRTTKADELHASDALLSKSTSTHENLCLSEIATWAWEELDLIERDFSVEIPLVELGLDSLGASKLSAHLFSTFHVDIAAHSILDGLSVKSLVDVILQTTEALQGHLSEVPTETALYDATADQERIWLLDSFGNTDRHYHLCATISVPFRLDIDVLRHSVREVINRHDVLRTSFTYTDEGLKGLVHPNGHDIATSMLSIIEPFDSHIGSIEDSIWAFATQKWNLSKVPAFRIAVVNQEAHITQLWLCMHHVIADGESLLIFFSELLLFYMRFSGGSPGISPATGMSYQSYAQQHRRWLKSAESKPSKAYWESQLDSIAPLRPERRLKLNNLTESASGMFQTDVDPRLLLGIREYSADLTVTPFEVLFSALALTLTKTFNTEQLVIGVPARRRNHAVQRTIGFFSSPIPIVAQVPNGVSFQQLVSLSSRTLRNAQQHATLSMADIFSIDRSVAKNAGQIDIVLNYIPASAAAVYAGFPEMQDVRLRSQPNDIGFFLTVWNNVDSGQTLCTFRKDFVSLSSARALVQSIWDVLLREMSTPVGPSEARDRQMISRRT